MLIRFKVSNFMSFYKEQEFCLFPSKVRDHTDHIYYTKKTTQTNILKSSVIYGANSSGKSNFLKAIHFAQKLIVKGTVSKQSINVPVFKLLQENKLPSKFVFEIYVKENSYEYGFEIQNKIISKEWLKKVSKTSERLFYKRFFENGKLKFKVPKQIKNKKRKMVFESSKIEVRNTQLFLTVLNNKNPEMIEEDYKNVYNWFENNLLVLFPDTKFMGIQLMIKKNQQFSDFYNKYLKKLDTGIDKLSFHEYFLGDENVPFPKSLKEEIENNLETPNTVMPIESRDNRERYYIQRQDDSIKAYKLKTIHKQIGSGKEIEFDFDEESDGTNRIFDIIPALYSLINSDKVVFVDEIDRSLHSLIPTKIFELFFEETKDKPSQFIVTTHDLHLLDLNKFRRDEIWFIRKDWQLQSQLYSLEEFKTRFDTRLIRAYLSGRFGAIPILEERKEKK